MQRDFVIAGQCGFVEHRALTDGQGNLTPGPALQGRPRTFLSVHRDAVDGNHDRKGDRQHDQAEHGDGAEIAGFIEVEDEHGDHLCFRGEEHDGGR